MGACMSSRASSSSHVVLLVGLDGSGSTTILYELVQGKYLRTIPTLGSIREHIVFEGVHMECWDIGGQESLRPLWLKYVPEANGVIFVVDSTDRARFQRAGVEISKLLARKKALRNVPLLIYANKQDLPNAMPVEQIKKLLNVKTLGSDHVMVFPCSGLDLASLTEGMQWFTAELNGRQS